MTENKLLISTYRGGVRRPRSPPQSSAAGSRLRTSNRKALRNVCTGDAGKAEGEVVQQVEWEAEFADFCVAEHSRLVGALSLYCGDRTLAEELAQDALSRACRDWKKVRRLGAPGAWTHRVAINLANSHFRRAAIELRAKRRLQEMRPPETPASTARPPWTSEARLRPCLVGSAPRSSSVTTSIFPSERSRWSWSAPKEP